METSSHGQAPLDMVRGTFHKRPIIHTPDDCWLWRGARSGKGYGNFQFGGRTYGAHRIAYLLKHGQSPAGAVIRHTCHNPDCVNPDHLVLGTHTTNSADSYVSGRANRKPVEHRLTVADAREIKRRRGEGEAVIDVARAFGVSSASVRRIDGGEIFSHVEGPPPKDMRGSGGSSRYMRGTHLIVAPPIIAPSRRALPRAPRRKRPFAQADAWDVKQLIAFGRGNGSISRELGIRVDTVRMIRKGYTWAWVTLDLPRGQSLAPTVGQLARATTPAQWATLNPNGTLTADAVRHMRQLRTSGATVEAIIDASGLSPHRVRAVLRGQSYRQVRELQ